MKTESLRNREHIATPQPLDQAMSRYANGDDSAFGEVWSALAPRLRTFLRRLCGSEELAEDLMQETFLHIHRARGSYVPGRPVLPWAHAIARNCFVSHVRTAKAKYAKQSLDINAIDEHETVRSQGGSAEEATSALEGAKVVKDALARMSVNIREAFVLVRFEGQSVAAAAEKLGATESAVKLRTFRAHALLRAALSDMDHEQRQNTRSTAGRSSPISPGSSPQSTVVWTPS